MQPASADALPPANSLTILSLTTLSLAAFSLAALKNRAIALLSLRAARIAGNSPRHAHTLSRDGGHASYQLFEADGSQRADIEAFIRRCYADNFNAQVDAFMPRLFGLRDAHGALCGAFGLRTASRRLFLEQYLQTDIEAAIAQHCGQTVARHAIVEVGHFSGSFPGAAREMIRLLTQHLRAENYAWVTFTGTSALRNAFGRMGLGLIDLAPADIRQIPAHARQCWGNYYHHTPRVMAGEICKGYDTLVEMQALPNAIAKPFISEPYVSEKGNA